MKRLFVFAALLALLEVSAAFAQETADNTFWRKTLIGAKSSTSG